MDETGRFFINCDMMRISWDIPNQHDLIFGLYNCNVSKSWFFILLLASNGYFLSSSSAWVENFADVTNFTGWKRFYSRVPCLECLCARYPILQTMTWQSLPLTLSNQISWCPGWMVHDSWWGGYSNKVWEWLKIAPKVDGEIMPHWPARFGSIKRPRWLDIPIPFFFFVISCPNKKRDKPITWFSP